MNEKTVTLNTAFGPVKLPPKQANDPVSEEDIIDTLIVDTFEKDEEGNVRPVTKQIVTGKKNRKAYIESFSDDVGLQHILEKIGSGAIAEDKYSILKSQEVGTVTDLRGFEGVQNFADLQDLADKARSSFEKLDPALKGNMSFAEFCSKFNNRDLNDYVSGKKEALEKAQKDKESKPVLVKQVSEEK